MEKGERQRVERQKGSSEGKEEKGRKEEGKRGSVGYEGDDELLKKGVGRGGGGRGRSKPWKSEVIGLSKEKMRMVSEDKRKTGSHVYSRVIYPFLLFLAHS